MIITIEKIVYLGKALGRGEDGIATFVEGALPGEKVDVTVTKAKKTFKEAKLVSVLEPSPMRIEPECPSFAKCGGCAFQHISYENQLKIKKEYVEELLKPVYSEPVEVIPSPEIWGYRNKMEFSYFNDNSGLQIGLHQKGEFNRYFPVPPCLISDKEMMPVLEMVLNFSRGSLIPCYDKRAHEGFYRHLVLRKAKSTGQLLVNLVTNAKTEANPATFEELVKFLKVSTASFHWTINSSVSDAVQADSMILLSGAETIEESVTVRGRKYSFIISPFSFFQTNTFGAEKLYELAVDFLEPAKTDTVLDLYCGTGTIGIIVAPFVKEVVGVEQVEDAVKDAEQNKLRNKIDNIRFKAGAVEKWLKSPNNSAKTKESFSNGGRNSDIRENHDLNQQDVGIKLPDKPVFNALILDPPRGGISTKVVKYIDQLKPEKIIYVSCNPSTLARDLALIIETSGYKINKIKSVDMFPHTYHIETVAQLTINKQ
ncbi:MAG: 23S rRNA (uracil(1939)-C(5))-methyltransferase RlmD [Elusimicrobiota bacterium]